MVRRFLQAGQLPPAEAIRLEEMIQYSAIDDSSEEDSRFVAAVASFARKLLGTPEADDLSWEEIESIAREAHAADSGSRRAELLALVEKARQLLVQRDSSGQ
jgi:coenzyme F420-reducing hydrogenase alpha subunit